MGRCPCRGLWRRGRAASPAPPPGPLPTKGPARGPPPPRGPRWPLGPRREAASASELKENMVAEPGYHVPDIDWRRTARRVLTLEWLDGIKLNDRDPPRPARH